MTCTFTALLLAPVLVAPPAQTSTKAPAAPTETPAQHTRTEVVTDSPAAALQHLDAARRILDSIDRKKLENNAEAREEIGALRKHFDGMLDAYRAAGGLPPVAKEPAGQAEQEKRPVDWRIRFSDVERTLAALVGGGPALDDTAAGSAAADRPVGTSGSTNPGAGGAIVAGRANRDVQATGAGIEDLDPDVRRQLHEFRRELELFFVATLSSHGIAEDPR